MLRLVLVDGTNKYELTVGDIVYSTPASLPIMKEASLQSEKIITIPKGTEVNILEILNSGWCYVYSSYIKGYILSLLFLKDYLLPR